MWALDKNKEANGHVTVGHSLQTLQLPFDLLWQVVEFRGF